ncbi:leucine-rich repeat-containing protein 9 [Polypterus senegalus]|uniref:leucine-rich repeat-containing protein 9 n=1 Tax=Polypterus senegalus TaxID=55291 RepID=UPI0019657F8C|nr:leucine-rich repeat-containing protein 9 [Polypterus senegalus]
MTPSEKHKLYADEEILKELCVGNGILYDKVSQDGESVSVLEMFFSGYPRMVGLSYFPKLTTLMLVGQSIRRIEGLDNCPLLRELWIIECQLTKIEGLRSCAQLQKLFLYDNKIGKIENLDSLEKLEVLWLNNNLINTIEGLKTLQSLRELNLADNGIEKIGESLDSNLRLEKLNLSGNKLCSFKELTRLANLPCLTDLALKDPQYHPNPVCLLCNYATHMIYHMPKLQRLDTCDISNKQIKDAAESIVMKKMMYYKMRVKTVQRQLAEMVTRLTEKKNEIQQLPVQQLRNLMFVLKSLEYELSEIQTSSPKPNSKSPTRSADKQHSVSEATKDDGDKAEEPLKDLNIEQKMVCKAAKIKERLIFWKRKMDEIEKCFQKELQRTTEFSEIMEQFLLMELETVGNIRFEEGCPSDVWFNSCYDLILSRFCASDFQAYQITGVKILRIVKVHNQMLKLRFEEKSHTLLASEESSSFPQSYKRLMDYLFYVNNPELMNGKTELLSILENGFMKTDSYKALGKEKAVPLSNSFSLCEEPRLENLKGQAEVSGQANLDPIPFRYGQLIIAKVFLGRSAQANEGPIEEANYPKAHSVFRTRRVPRGSGAAESKEASCTANQHGNCDCSLRQNEWFVFDHELVLPEYVIDFEYLTEEKPMLQFSSLLEVKSPGVTDEGSSNLKEVLFKGATSLDEEILNMEPIYKPKPKIISLDEKTILSVCKANILSQITILNLHGNSLNKLKDLSCLTSLRKLSISFNEFTHLEDVSHLPNLEYLDASHNHIAGLEGMRSLSKLKHFDLSWNCLTRVRDEIAILRKHTPALLYLDISNNPWLKTDSLRLAVIGRLKSLTHLNGVPVTEEEAAAALKRVTGSRITQVSLLAHSRTDEVRPRSLSLLSSAQVLSQLSNKKLSPVEKLETGWYLKITSLNLNGVSLTRLTNLDKLHNLRWASFNDNDISKIEGLDNCQRIEELSLDGNCISKLEGLLKLTKLTRLSLNNNRLTSLDTGVLEKLPHLHCLSVENNHISSLQGLHKVSSLIEFYIGNNNISTNRDIYHLKGLSNLIILDLYGNPIVQNQENYRLFVIFHLPTLKALDGSAVEPSECENAKDAFGGRLTPDMVTEKLGHSDYSDVHELDLPGSAIRTVDLSPAELFKSLRSVNLEHNSLTSFCGLIFLPNVKVLYLNHNHIESILPRQKTQSQATNRPLLYHKVASSGYGQPSNSKGFRDTGLTENQPIIMESLEVLHLGYNGISNLLHLQIGRLGNLKALYLQGNEISQIEGLESLQRLQELVLDRNRIKSINDNSFVGQTSLAELHLSENRIRELSNLQPLPELRKLFLGTNKIQDMTELEKLESLPKLTELTLTGNPVSRKVIYRSTVILRIPGLQTLDGTGVTVEERTRAELQLADQQGSVPANSTLEIGLSGFLPVMTKPAPLRMNNMHMTGGLQHLMSQDVLTHGFEDALPHETIKYKKYKHTSGLITTNSRSVHAEIAFRQLRGGSGFPSASAMQQNLLSRLLPSYPNSHDQERRFQRSSAHRPARM